MPQQLPVDCLNENFKYLKNKVDLHSCLLVNHLWCEASVRILWTSIQNYNTLVACLPNESKKILFKNQIIISTSISKPPSFNYVAFIKSFSLNKIVENILPQSFNIKKVLVVQEIFKMFMNQISLKTLDLYSNSNYIQNIPFLTYPGATECLRNLSELNCSSNICSKFFYQLSQICHHIQSLGITFEGVISNGLSNLISVQQNLKNLTMCNIDNRFLTNIMPSLMKHSNTLIKLNFYDWHYYTQFSFVAKFINLQELVISSYNYAEFFKNLQHITFSQLQILKFEKCCPNHEYLTKFLENNGTNLKELLGYIEHNSINLAIAKFCPNLKSLSTIFKVDEIETLKMIFNSCQQLESLRVWCGHRGDFKSLHESDLFEVVAKYSPKKFYELRYVPSIPYFKKNYFQSLL